MSSSSQRTSPASHEGLIGPQADPAFARLAAPEIRRRTQLAHVVHALRTAGHAVAGRPLGAALLQVWLKDWPGAATVERMGLPRHSLERLLGEPAFILHLDPRSLIQFAMHPPGTRKKPSSAALIWDGDWDLCRVDLRSDYALRFIRDLDTHRHDLTRTEKYRELTGRIAQGRPFHSHQEGFYLNTPQRVLDWLHVYLEFLDTMARSGYQKDRAKDYPGVGISRDGRLVKMKRGAHRLAMAQWLGLPSIPVKVTHVHRLWWDTITQGERGLATLERACRAWASAPPEHQPGPLSPPPPAMDAGPPWPERAAD